MWIQLCSLAETSSAFEQRTWFLYAAITDLQEEENGFILLPGYCEDKYFKGYLGSLFIGMELSKYLKHGMEMHIYKLLDSLHSSLLISWVLETWSFEQGCINIFNSVH